jgi:lysophospholipase L1-like esterase
MTLCLSTNSHTIRKRFYHKPNIALLENDTNATYDQTQIFGDSILVSDSPIQSDLEKLSGIHIKNYATVGAGMKDGWVKSIPSQYFENKETYGVPLTIIMDGGGNDVNSVRSECQQFSEACRNTIDDVVTILQQLWKQMASDGVAHILYVGMYYISGFRQAVDYGAEEIQRACHDHDISLGKNLTCYFVDLRNVSIQVGWDGMHPMTQGYHDIASEIWKVKEEHNVPFP